MNKTVLITGATGFLGSHISLRLFRKGFNIIILKRSFSDLWRINKIINNIKFYDIDKVELEVPFRENKIDFIIHAATNYGRQKAKLEEIIETNINYPIKLLEIAIFYKTDAFFNTDTSLNRYINYYSLSKKQFVEWLRIFKDKIKIFNFKLEYVYGEMDDYSKFIPFIIRELILKVKEIKLTGGQQKRDFIYVEDVVSSYEAILDSFDKYPTGFYEYEIGTGIATSIKEVVLLLKELTLNDETYLNFGGLSYRDNEIMESKANLKKIKEDVGWEPKVSLKEGLEKVVNWYKNNIRASDV